MARQFNVLFCLFVCFQLVNCQFGFLSDVRSEIRNTVSGAIGAVGNLFHPQQNPITVKPTQAPNPDSPFSAINSVKPVKPIINKDRPVSTIQTSNPSHGSPVIIAQTSHPSQDRPVSTTDRPVSTTTPNPTRDRPVVSAGPDQFGSITFTSVTTGGKSCVPVNGGEGECVTLHSCGSYMAVMRDSISSPVITWMLRQAHCGFEGNDPMVCCPIEDDQKDEKANQIEPGESTQATPKEVKTTALPTTLPPTTPLPTTTTPLPTTTTTLPTTTTTLPSSASTITTTRRLRKPPPMTDLLSLLGETCNTVYNTTGSCKDVYLCAPLLALAKQARSDPAAAAVLHKSACGFKNNIPQVCCPLPVPPTQPPSTTAQPSADARAGGDFIAALPEPPVCGLSNVSLDRVVGGVPARLGAFPWMALLGYRDLAVAAGMQWKCGGALVSSRHVLTAAHCIHHLEDDLYVVRLGELDLARDDEGATPVDVPIKAMYKHELYTKNNPVINDVGVLVLARDVEFTTLIRPICLFTAASSEWRSETFEDYNPFVAGWGDLEWKGRAATHLQVVQLPVLSQAACERAYAANVRASRREQFSQQAMCAGYLSGAIDSCSGDSGGPLQQPIVVEGLTPRTYIYAIGIVSFGRKCAQPGSPGVYARLSYYMPWIEEKILGRAS